MTTPLRLPPGSDRVHRIDCTWHRLTWRPAEPCARSAYARSRFGNAVFLCRAHYAALRRGDAVRLAALSLALVALPLGLLFWQVHADEVQPMALGFSALGIGPAAALGLLARHALREGGRR